MRARTKSIHYSTRSYFFFLCGGDTAAVLPVHPTLYVYLSVSLFISSRLCCLSSDTDLLLFLYVPYLLVLLAHDAYVNRTMIL